MKNDCHSTQLTLQQQHKGIRLVYAGQGVGVILPILFSQSAFGVLLIKHLGGSDLQAMLLGSLFTLPRFLQIPVSLRIPPSKGKRFLLRCWAGNAMAITLVIIIISSHFADALQINLILLFITIGAIVATSGETFWFPILHDLVPGNQRGRFFGKLRSIWRGTSFAAIAMTGFFLGEKPPLWKFQLVIITGLILYLTRNILIAKIPRIDSLTADDDFANWRQYIRQMLSRREVLIFCGYYSMMGSFAGFLGTPLVLYMQDMGFLVRDNLIIFGFTSLGQAGALLFAGVLTDMIGTKRLFLFAHLVLCVVCFSVVRIGWLPPEAARPFMLVSMIVAGAMLAMAGVACTTQLFHLTPDRGRAFFMSLAMILMTTGMMLAPVLTGYIRQITAPNWAIVFLNLHLNIFQFLLCISGIGLLILIVVLLFVEDVRPGETRA